jgi:hypothetical protein
LVNVVNVIASMGCICCSSITPVIPSTIIVGNKVVEGLRAQFLVDVIDNLSLLLE